MKGGDIGQHGAAVVGEIHEVVRLALDTLPVAVDSAIGDCLDFHTLVAHQIVPSITKLALGEGGVHGAVRHFDARYGVASVTGQVVVGVAFNAIRG